MSVWYCIPSARPPAEANACLRKWRERGYRVAVQRDPGHGMEVASSVDAVYERPYAGYAEAVNWLAKTVLTAYPECQIMVTGGDDTDPDPTHDPAVLEQEFIEGFGGTFGVMQPTGDRWMEDEQGRSSEERVCSSPWIGREFAKRMYGGAGPLWPGWFHFFEDEELHEVAHMMGVLWHRRDIVQYHRHWIRNGGVRPQHLSDAKLDWAKAKALFEERKTALFPGYEPATAFNQIRSLAKWMESIDPGLSPAQAILEASEASPDLRTKYLDERKRLGIFA